MPRQINPRFTFEPLKGVPFEGGLLSLEDGLPRPFKLELRLASHYAVIDLNRLLDLAGPFSIPRGEAQRLAPLSKLLAPPNENAWRRAVSYQPPVGALQ
ncbi:MAG: hypothetical protein ACRESJ_14515 [Pseudomonas sp.]|uniref:hypothetical protein n=1 Tax=Pseudomonas sp. TaxID=306 RepID=UPI003D6EEBCE